MTSQPGTQTIASHVLLNISRSKSNQKPKFGQSIEYLSFKLISKNFYFKLALPSKISQRDIFKKRVSELT